MKSVYDGLIIKVLYYILCQHADKSVGGFRLFIVLSMEYILSRDIHEWKLPFDKIIKRKAFPSYLLIHDLVIIPLASVFIIEIILSRKRS